MTSHSNCKTDLLLDNIMRDLVQEGNKKRKIILLHAKIIYYARNVFTLFVSFINAFLTLFIF